DYPTPRTGMALPYPYPNSNAMNDRPPTQILIPTGGSSGNLRFAVHTWETLSGSVQGFQQHFQSPVVNAYCVLPLFHVSGLMQAMRCLLSGGQLILQPFQTLLQEGAIASPSDNLFLSLVPTQLQRLLNSGRDFIPWLRQFTAILLGGAPAWPSLLNTARDLQLPLSPTYGMTETASQVATLLPAEFLAGNTGSGRALPHASITIRDNTGQSLAPNQTGHIAIEAKSLAQGYNQTPLTSPFQTGDLGHLDESGYLYVQGRQKALIITGGEKVLPEEVEAAILTTGMVQDVIVIGIPDEDWGEVVVAVVVPAATRPVASLTQNARTEYLGHWNPDRLIQYLKSQLSPYKLPKHWLVRTSLPRNPQDKLNRTALGVWVEQQLQQRSPIAPATQSVPGQVDSAVE
ncbi:MAG: AMP-binding protein, partial [Cyanobacteria bacterium J06636_16]